MIISSIILNNMQKDPCMPRTPHSTDKLKPRHCNSKSLSKYGQNTPSPVVHGKNSQKEVRDLGVIKEKIKKKPKDDKKTKDKIKSKEQPKGKEKETVKSKKKTNFSTNLKQLKPINLQKQKQLFFQSSFKRNPFFVYNNISDIQDDDYRQSFKDGPHGQHLQLAMRVLEKGAHLRYWQQIKEGNILSMQQTERSFIDYINLMGFSDVLTYEFAENTVATTSVVHNNQGGPSTVIVGLPIRYTNHTIEGVMNHEIGTHFLRKYNDRGQKWYRQRKKFNLGNYLQTEEGLAALNQLIPFVLKGKAPPLLFRAALLYLGCYLASRVSFCQLFHILQKHQPDPDMRWRECVRVKRGIADTTKPGGMYKDQIYFMGAIEILRNRHQINFHQFHCGKFSLEDYFRLREKGLIQMNERTKYPHFLQDKLTYLKCLDHIAEFNQIK